MGRTRILLLIVYVGILSCSKNDEKIDNTKKPDDDTNPTTTLIGKTLPDWQDGYLDIHAINTGRGESTLCIFPDGTTMLIDAAGSLISATDAIPPPPQKPNINVSPGLAITNYAKYFIKPASNRLNYLMLSHFDPDHMGSYATSLPLDATGAFRIGGITEVGVNIAFDKILDRGYPNYDFPKAMSADSRMANYIKFTNWAKTAYNATAEQFDVGKTEQIVLKRNPAKYANFQIRNIVGNGKVWTGTGTSVTNTLPAADEVVAADPDENVFCIGFLLSYGKFNYFTAGDLQYNGRTAFPWKDIEAPVAKVVTSVDVMKANHHGTDNCNSEELLNKLKPNVVVAHTWRDVQPNLTTIGRMYAANSTSQIFTTNMTDANKVRLSSTLAKLKGMQGHIVVRVEPGGNQYSVYVLDDSNQEYKVTKIFGPYQSN